MERYLRKNDIKFHPLNTIDWKENNSILERYRFAGGRRFHNVEGVPYFLANDQEEISRLQIHNTLYKYIWQGIYSSPMHDKLVSGGFKVLDSGCGPGTWVLDMANAYKKSIVIGVDLSPSMFPSVKNDNVAFLEGNIINGFPFPNETFDFVHQGFMSLALTEKHWQDVILDMIRVTKPGGWIEFIENDVETYFAGPLTEKFMKSFQYLLEARGLNPFIASRIENYLKATNEITDIHIESKATPLGSSKLGDLLISDYLASISHAKSYICELMGIPIEEYNDFVENVKKECEENKSYIKSYRIYGRKI